MIDREELIAILEAAKGRPCGSPRELIDALIAELRASSSHPSTLRGRDDV